MYVLYILCYLSYITYYMLHILKSIVWLVTSWARLLSCPATFRPRALEPLRSSSSSSSLLENGLYGGSRSGLYGALKEILPLLTFTLALLLATKGISFSSDPFLPLNSLVSLSCLRGESHQNQNGIKQQIQCSDKVRSKKKNDIFWDFFPTWGGGSSQIPKLL